MDQTADYRSTGSDSLIIDRICDEFEQALQADGSVRIEDYLSKVAPPLRSAAIRELLLVEIEVRRGRRETVGAETFSDRLPEFESEIAAVFSSDVVLATTAHGTGNRRSPSPDAKPRSGRGSRSGQLEVRCPNCHAPTEVAVDTSLTDLTCSSCGSHFSLVDQTKATRMAPSLSKLGRFELVERIGVGGFGSVWKARDKELDRTVAIKIPRDGGMTAEEQEKFFREARAAAQLRHRNIVSVHEVGRDGESVYIVSDFVRGITLGDYLTGQKLTSREAAELCAKIAEALHHAHEQGVVHRDLKPANIMIDGDGEPHLMDFGLARREVGEVTVTMDGQILGTPAYMSPEQAQGEAHKADRRSDVYSLGVIVFQLLTGELPFRGNARMLMHQVIHDEPPSPRKLNSNIKKDLETITLKSLEKLPAKRYQTAAELAAELRRFLDGKPILARPVNRVERAWRWCRRNLVVATLLCTAAMLMIGMVVGFALYAERQRKISEYQTLLAQQERNLRERMQGDLYHSFLQNAIFGQFDARHNNDPQWMHEVLEVRDKQLRAGHEEFPREREGIARVHRRLAELIEQGSVTSAGGTLAKYSRMPLEWSLKFYRWPGIGYEDPPKDWESVVRGKVFHDLSTRDLNYDWGAYRSPGIDLARSYYAIVATTTASFPAGRYRLISASDDGIRVYVDKRRVIDNWNMHGELTDIADVALSDGSHTIRIDYFQIVGSASLRFGAYYVGPDDGTAKSIDRAELPRPESVTAKVDGDRQPVKLSADSLWEKCRSGVGGVKKAIDESLQVTESTEADPRTLCCVGELRLLAGRPTEAVQLLERAVSSGGSAAFYQKSLGWALWASGRRDEARNAFESAIGGAPLESADLNRLAAAYFLSRLDDEKFVELARSKSNVGASFAWFYIGQKHAWDGEQEAAKAAFDQAVQEAEKTNSAGIAVNWSAYCREPTFLEKTSP